MVERDEDRLGRSLLDAVVDLASELDLHTVLERIVRAACSLSGAQYGALGVLSRTRTALSDFVTYGLSEEDRARIGTLPQGRGILGLLIDDPRPLRLTRLGDHPKSYGFPPHHPPMNTFLGVPVHAGGQVFGNLYLTEKKGGGPFTEQDESLVLALAAAAGVAVQNARLYQAVQRRGRLLSASAAVTDTLLAPGPRNEALRLIVSQAREATEASLCVLAYEETEEGGGLRVNVAEGPEGTQLTGLEVRSDSPVVTDMMASLTETAETRLVDDVSAVLHASGGAALAAVKSVDAALLAPFASAQGVRGLLLVAFDQAATTYWEDEQRAWFAGFASQTALALERAQAHEDRELLAVLEDRDRIARDLHDLVIQRLFALGLGLQSARRLIVRPDVLERVDKTIDEIDATIQDIRGAIFELHHHPGESSLQADVRQLVAEYIGVLGFTPRINIRGPIDAAVPAVLQPTVLAVIREGVSNVVRHARATAAWVEVAVSPTQLTVLVVDNGVGIGELDRVSGLRNLRQRAQDFSGELELTPHRPTGTTLSWQVPLGAAPVKTSV